MENYQLKGFELQNLNDKEHSPIVAKMPNESEDAFDLIAYNKAEIENILHDRGAILFRGMKLASPTNVQKITDIMLHDVLKNNAEHIPVSAESQIQRPVHYSPNDLLLWHNENTFNQSFPSKAIFACETKNFVGGETPIADSRMVFQHIDDHIKQAFMDKQVMYVRKYEEHNLMGLGWKTIFHTSEKSVVEDKCKELNLDWEWKEGDKLITRAVRPATFVHPVSGSLCWTNQAQHWHFSCLNEDVRDGILMLFDDEKDYPRNCYFGDGTAIPDEFMAHILSIYKDQQMQFEWQQGDLLFVDNILKAHARNPYQGERKLLVCFGNVISYND
jgi:alpha-ketoglutarate-dependent taurine dioxygenase